MNTWLLAGIIVILIICVAFSQLIWGVERAMREIYGTDNVQEAVEIEQRLREMEQ